MPTYTTPTRRQSRSMHVFDRMRGHNVGRTLLREGGAWSLVENPTTDRIQAAERCYRGGYTYDLSTALYNEIPAVYGGGGS